MQVIADIFFALLENLVGHKERKAGKIFWSQRLIFLGVILTAFGFFLLISTSLSGMIAEMWCGVSIFLVSGVPILALGIFMRNNPS